MEVEDDNRDEAMGEDLEGSLTESSVSSLNPVEQFSPRASTSSIRSTLKTCNGDSVMAAAGTQGSVTISLHPLVIMNISDHWTRVKSQEGSSKKVIGALIGQQKGRHLELMNSFELSYDIIDEAYVFDKDYYSMKETQFKQVFSEMEFLGWYTTGGEPDQTDIQLHRQVTEFHESAIFLKLNPVAKDTEHLPVSVYESLIDIVEGETKVLFLQIPYTLATEEAERIGVDHVARFTSSVSGSNSQVAEHLQAQFGAVKMLHSRIKFILEYLKAMDRGEVHENHEILRLANAMSHQLPVFGGSDFYAAFYNQCNDVALVAYLASITKSCQTMNQFVNKFNILHDRHLYGRRMRGIYF